uniref:hypothetical protein n=1 Tax=Lysobacter firmicutimachus TaxID=1792846 RepID=UPI003F4D8370
MTAADRTADAVRAELDTVLRYAVAIGALLVLMLPAARGHHGTLGWLPLWLVAMPAVAWWALHRFALPLRRRRAADPVAAGLRRRRRGAVQARRRARGPAGVRAWPRVA